MLHDNFIVSVQILIEGMKDACCTFHTHVEYCITLSTLSASSFRHPRDFKNFE